MGRLAGATRRSTARLRTIAQDIKGLRGTLDEARLQNGIAVLVKAARRLPDPEQIQDLLDEVKAHWDAEPPAKGKASADQDAKRDLLRQASLQFKQIRKVALVLAVEAKRDAQTFDFVAQSARDIIRAPAPTIGFTLVQMSEWLGLARVFALSVQRYARRIRSS